MRGRFSIFVFVFVVLALLAALNAASYVRVSREPELEAAPDRSTLNAGPTGTRALYEYLEASGRRVARWRESPAGLSKVGGSAAPAVFVFAGPARRAFTEDDKQQLMDWVARGGRLVVIDRQPEELLPTGERWGVASSVKEWPGRDSRADNAEQLLAGTQPLAPTQPTLYASAVERVAPSRYAARLGTRSRDGAPGESDTDDDSTGDDPTGDDTDARPPTTNSNASESSDDRDSRRGASHNSNRGGEVGPGAGAASVEVSAPVFNFTDERGALVAEYRRGRGRVVVLADPFVVANNGVARADNLQLAANLLDAGGGLVVFDEYHQGRGVARNQIGAYFAGTPVLPMLGQLAAVAAAFFYSRGRRFARPLPAERPDRRSKLEFVASMAELQQRARAFDLALENIYSRTRRALARYGGTDTAAPREQIAAAVAARSGAERTRLENLMRDCEDAIAGQPLSARRALHLTAELRELERALGIRMRAREIRQAAARREN